MVAFIDLTGRRFGRLVVQSRDSEKSGKRIKWICLCDCGGRTSSVGANLTRGGAMSCGHCRTGMFGQANSNFVHGARYTRLYKIWTGIVQRTTNPKAHGYKNYGGRGIKICPEWRSDFAAFAAAVGQPPSAEHTLDRRDNDKGYQPGNMRWATRKEQVLNRRATRFVLLEGQRLCLTDAAKTLGISRKTLARRVGLGEIPEVTRA